MDNFQLSLNNKTPDKCEDYLQAEQVHKNIEFKIIVSWHKLQKSPHFWPKLFANFR